MTTLTLAIVIVFCIGYFFIAIESITKINKAAIALLMLVATWTLFMLDPASYLPRTVYDQMESVVSEAIERHLGSTSTTLFFLMGAMTIVELVDQNGGFNFVRDVMKTRLNVPHIEVPTPVSLAVIFGVLLLSMLFSVVVTRTKGTTPNIK